MSEIIEKNNIIKQAKQQFIVDKTVELIENSGINNITMDTIAYQANYTKRTLYSYFISKDEILLWLFTDDLTKRWNYQKQRLLRAKSGIEKLNLWAISLFEYCDSNKYTLQVQNYMDYHFVNLTKVSTSIFGRFEKINNKLAEALRDILVSGVEDGSFRKEIEIDITISQFLYSYRAILNRAFSEKYSFVQFDRHDYIYHFLNLFLKSLVA